MPTPISQDLITRLKNNTKYPGEMTIILLEMPTPISQNPITRLKNNSKYPAEPSLIGQSPDVQYKECEQ